VNIGNIAKVRALRDSASFPEEVPLGSTKQLTILKSWTPVMTYSAVPLVGMLRAADSWSAAGSGFGVLVMQRDLLNTRQC